MEKKKLPLDERLQQSGLVVGTLERNAIGCVAGYKIHAFFKFLCLQTLRRATVSRLMLLLVLLRPQGFSRGILIAVLSQSLASS